MIRRLLDNLGYKLLSLLIAVLLWVIFVGYPEYFLHTLPDQLHGLMGG